MRLALLRLKLQHLLVNKELRCLKCGGKGFLGNPLGAYRGECPDCTLGFLPRGPIAAWVLKRLHPKEGSPFVNNAGSNLGQKNQGIFTQTKPGS